MRVLNWLRTYWYVPLTIAGLVLLWLLTRDRGSSAALAGQLKAEIDAARASAETRKVQAELGAEKAREHVEHTYQEQLQQLSDEQAAQAKELEDDPAALSRFLVRAGASKPAG